MTSGQNCVASEYESQEVSSRYAQMFVRQVQWNYESAVLSLSYFFLSLGEGEIDENEDSNFEIVLHFEAAIVAV